MPEQPAHRDPSEALNRLITIVDALRAECGWTAKLTPESLAPYLVEEAAEVSETVRRGELGQPLASELGDILFQLMLHSRLGEERGDLDLVDVIQAITDKLLRRNTHVFAADGSVLEHPDHDPVAAERAWAQAKLKERTARGTAPADADPLRGLPRSLPALLLAQKALSRAESGHTPSGIDAASPDTAERIGDDLLVLVGRARAAGVDAESALRNALERAL